MSSNLAPLKIWSFVYYYQMSDGNVMGVAFVKAGTKQMVMYRF